jgi:outer membrane protein
MKNIPLVLSAVLALMVGHLYYLNLQKPASNQASIVPPAGQMAGAKIAWVNADTLNEKYEWLKQQKTAIEQRMKNAGNSLVSKRDALNQAMAALEQKAQEGNTPPAELEKEYAALQDRGAKLQAEASRLDQQIAEDQKKAFDDLYANVEVQLKTLSTQIGYDYILSYTRGGQILLANDSLDITKQVLDLLNVKK